MSIFEVGKVSEKEVQWIRDSIARFGVNERTATFLLDVNNLLSGHVPPSFHDVFLDSLTTFVLDEQKVITPDRWSWLKGNLLKDDVIDGVERELLGRLRDAARGMPDEMRSFGS
ncbi:hypothetical protein [Paramagnetospirillum kuznetsovii]|nr:hypothetical protein [Paramagnetospirillum kuznetsovii]